MALVLVLLLLLLSAISAEALAGGNGVVRETSLDTFHGLRSLFARTRASVDQQFSDTDLPCSLLHDDVTFQQYLRQLPPYQQPQLEQARLQALAYWQQFLLVAYAVTDDARLTGELGYADACQVFDGERSWSVSIRSTSSERDRLVERMLMLGYSSKEVVDVLAGRLTLHELRQASRMQATGRSNTEIAAYLQSRYRRSPDDSNSPAGQRGSRYNHHVERYARRYGLDPELVRAIITHESGWRADARSRVGAIGLMQLMPATARMLGVDPLDPEQNIEGGVRYLASLLEMFDGDLDSALISYNAGPAYAQQWRDGKITLYGETRDYLARVKRSYSHAML